MKIIRGSIRPNKYKSIHSPGSKRCCRTPTHTYKWWLASRKHASCYRLQEHHVIPPKPFSITSTQDVIRSNLFSSTPSSFRMLFASSTLTSNSHTLALFSIFILLSPLFSRLTLHLLSFQGSLCTQTNLPNAVEKLPLLFFTTLFLSPGVALSKENGINLDLIFMFLSPLH